MSKLIRVYKRYDIKDIKPHLMICGDLSASCANCNEMDFKITSALCPKCGHEFKFIAFRNPKSHMPKIHKIFDEQRNLIVIDYDDYKKGEGSSKVDDFFR